MISRLTASAALFAFLATVGLGFTAQAQQGPVAKQAAPTTAMPSITMPLVTITGKRLQRK